MLRNGAPPLLFLQSWQLAARCFDVFIVSEALTSRLPSTAAKFGGILVKTQLLHKHAQLGMTKVFSKQPSSTTGVVTMCEALAHGLEDEEETAARVMSSKDSVAFTML